MAYGRVELPSAPPLSVRSGYDLNSPTQAEYGEIIYDPRTARYITLSQQREIDELQNQLANKEKKRHEDIKSIIGYFYKSR